MARPGRALVSSPRSTTTWPPTTTYGIPAEGMAGILVRGAVDDRRRIEESQVRVGADANAALVRHGRRSALEASRRLERHPPEGVHQRHHAFVPHVAAEDLGIGTRRARVSPPVFDEAVAGDHRERAGNRGARLLLGSPVDDHRAPGLPRLLERRSRQALAGGHELVQGKALVGPARPVVEEGRLDLRHPGAVGIRLGRHVLTRVTGRLDGGEKLVEVVTRRRIDMHDVQRRARGRLRP